MHRPDLHKLAEEAVQAMGRLTARGALHRLQWALLFYHVPPEEIAIIGDPSLPATQALVAAVYRDYLPNKVVALATPAQAAKPDATPLIKLKTLIKNQPAAYVCRNYLCKKPTTAPDELAKQLVDVTP